MLKQFREILPAEDCLYFGDTLNMPYGEKTKEELIEFSNNIFKFFETKNVKAVVMACNTTSSMAYESLKDNYNFKIYPIIQSVTSMIAQIPVKNIGVFATPATINSHAYKNGLTCSNNQLNIIEIACPEWVRIVEEKAENMPESLNKIKTKMDEMLFHNPEKIILGCTHYPYLLNLLKKYAPEEMFINPAIKFTEYIKKDLEKHNLLNPKNTKGYEKFYVSSRPEQFRLSGSMFYEVKELPELIKL